MISNLQKLILFGAAFFLLTPLLAASGAGSVAALSYLGNMSFPRGMRNNNPGNIRISPNAWKGKIPMAQNNDKAFEQFEFYVYGIRAMIINLRSYFNSGANTIRKIINKWAPSYDGNDTLTYINTVSVQTGFSPDQTLKFDAETVQKLVRSMTYVENGRDAVQPDQFNYAWKIL